MRTSIHIQDGFMEFLCVIDFIMKSTSKPQVTASDYTVENVSSDENISRYATKTEHAICKCSRLMRTQDGFMEFLCVIDFIMKSTSWPLVTLSDNTDEDVSYMATLKSFRLKHPKNLVACHLNINSIRRKFTEVSELCSGNIVDILFLSETKLDASFPTAQFHISGFKCHRADRNCNGGGIMVYIRSDIAHRRRNDMENAVTSPIESLIIEVIIRKENWLFACLYNPHNKYKAVCCESIDEIFKFMERESISMPFIVGDLNINLLDPNESKCLTDCMDVTGLQNIIKGPTCFKGKDGTLLDIVLTTSPRRVASTVNLNTGVSDFHHLVGFATKITVPKTGNAFVTYRSYKKFNEAEFRQDVANAPHQVSEIFDDIEDKYWFYETLTNEIINSHAPLKKRKTVANPVPFMNSAYRKACYQKSMAHNRYFKMGKTHALWQKYRKARNHAAKLRAASVKNFFDTRYNSQFKENPKRYWDTIKPFMTDKKVNGASPCFTLKLGNDIINDSTAVSDAFNDFFQLWQITLAQLRLSSKTSRLMTL